MDSDAFLGLCAWFACCVIPGGLIAGSKGALYGFLIGLGILVVAGVLGLLIGSATSGGGGHTSSGPDGDRGFGGDTNR